MQKSELIINQDGSVYHLHLKPGEVAPTIITVGDPNRVHEISKFFDTIRVEKQNREFYTVTGTIGTKAITVVSTGIGTDNIDIVLNELDALFNVDFSTGKEKDTIKTLEIIRIGTSGSIQEDIEVGSLICSSMAIGLEGLMHNYSDFPGTSETILYKELMDQSVDLHYPINPYVTKVSNMLAAPFGSFTQAGITITAGGFYAPQGRHIRLNPRQKDIIFQLKDISLRGQRVSNLEMETAGIYGLAGLMGHRAVSLNAILANRITGVFSNQSEKTVEKLIRKSLEVIRELPD